MKLKLYDDYQTPAANKVIWALKKCAKALMVMATGLGKTIVSAFVVDHFLTKPKTQRVLVLCHDTGILKQCFKKYRAWFGDGDYTYAHFYGRYKKKNNWNIDQHTFMFATFQSKPHLFFKADHFDFIIVDEGHHAKAPTYDKVMQFFNPKWKLGMTATPDREDLQDIRHIFGKEVVNNDLPEAMARGWLTPVEYKILSDGLDRDILQALVDKVSVEKVRITESQLNEMIFIPARTEKQCESILKYTRNGLKAIVFCSNIDHLNHVMEFLPNSVAVHSDQTDDENEDAMEAYKKGFANHILVVDKFNEGIDLPDTDVLVFLRSTNSYRIWVQQLGRGVRLFEGKHRVVVLDFVANIERIRNVHNFVQQIGSFTNTFGGLNQEFKLDAPLHIEGSNFMFDFSEEVVSVLGMLEYMVQIEYYKTWQEASMACRKLGIKSSQQYRAQCQSLDPRLYIAPEARYVDFPGWHVFLFREIIPVGWKTASILSLELCVVTGTVKNFVKKFRMKHSDWFKDFYIENGHLVEHYSPELVTTIKEEFLDKKNLNNFVTLDAIAQKTNVGKRTIQNLFEKFKVTNPEFFKKIGIINYYNSKLIEEVIKSFPKKLDGWIIANQLGIQLGTHHALIKEVAERFRKDHPEWFKVFHTSRGLIEHYHPKLVLEIEKAYNQAPKKLTEEWHSAESLSRIVVAAPTTIKIFAESFRKTHQNWFKNCLVRSSIAECYHPTLVEKIMFSFFKRSDLEKGWYNNYVLAKEVKISIKKLKNYTDKFTQVYPNWFQIFSRESRISVYYHPDLVKKVKEHFAPSLKK
jgi:superfamily II DNA or RNA helicase